MTKNKSFLIFLVLVFLCIWAGKTPAADLVVFSARSNSLTRIPFSKFQFETGINIKVVDGNVDELLQRLVNEGENCPADVLITVDAGSLWKTTQMNLLQPVVSTTLSDNIPAHLRDLDNHWFGLSKRARTIVYSIERISPSELSTYEDLADPRWKNRLCLRTSKKVYNQSLVAMMISRHSADQTENIVRGWVRNLAGSPYSKDSEVISAIAEGKCDVGIVNHYYLGKMLKIDPGTPVAIFWPNQADGDSGVYMDISGAGVTKYARNTEEAIKFLEWLSSERAQDLFADSNMEYPVNQKVRPNSLVLSWGDFRQYTENIGQTGIYRSQAIELMRRAGYE